MTCTLVIREATLTQRTDVPERTVFVWTVMVSLCVVRTVFVRHSSVTGLISVLVNQAGQEKNVTQVGEARWMQYFYPWL